ncbi:MAG: hypothetical protein JWN11_1859 [Hyphomicrobiales bacterium]|nr:hypothetical protein [Hyphomicrobiales bacterium]
MVMFMKTSAFIVEDDPLALLLCRDALKSLGYGVSGAVANIDAAMSAVIAQPPDIAIMTLELGNESTAILAARCRRLGVGVIFVTTYLAKALPDWCRNAPVLTKPYAREDLFLALKEAEEKSLRSLGSVPESKANRPQH